MLTPRKKRNQPTRELERAENNATSMGEQPITGVPLTRCAFCAILSPLGSSSGLASLASLERACASGDLVDDPTFFHLVELLTRLSIVDYSALVQAAKYSRRRGKSAHSQTHRT